MIEYVFKTSDAAEALAIFGALNKGVSAVASAGATLIREAPVSAPKPPKAQLVPTSPASPEPPPFAAPAPVPVASVAAPPVAARGTAPEGWTEAHIAHAAKAHADTFGPASLKALVQEFGASRATQIDPARWPEAYARLSEGTAAQG